jgi:hypothetical protein
MSKLGHLPSAGSTSLVRLGGITFDDFVLFEPDTVRQVLTDAQTQSLLGPALGSSPRALLHFIRSCPDIEERMLDAVNATPAIDPAGIAAARRALVHRHAYELLMAKSPALYETLPWLDWDFGIVSSRVRLWRTRLLLAGDGTSITITRCRRTAGITVVEPRPGMARYIERKAELARVRRVVVRQDTLTGGHLAGDAYDLAIIALPLTEDIDRVLPTVEAVAGTILLLALRPDPPAIPGDLLTRRGYRPESVRIAGSTAQRPCWWWSLQS